MSEESLTLARLARARSLLIEARTLEDVLHIRDVARAAETYLRAAKEAGGAANEAAEVRIRAERKAGEILAQTPKNRGAEGIGTADGVRSQSATAPTLDDLGVTRSQSSRWQQVAAIPEPVVDEYVAGAKERGKEITTAGLMRAAGDASAQSLERMVGDDDRVRRARLAAEVARHFASISALALLDVSSVSELLSDVDAANYRLTVRMLTEWFAQVMSARGTLRIVEGGT